MKLIYAWLMVFLVTIGCHAAPPTPMPVEINSRSQVAPELWAFRANQRTYRATFKDGTNATDVTGATFFMSWSTNELSTGVITAEWAVVSATGGVVDFTFIASRLNYAFQSNVYEIGVNDSNGALAVYNRGRFLIKPSPFATGTNVVPFTTNFNLAGYAFVNQPWVENLTVTTSGSAFVWSGTGTTRNLQVPTGLGGGSGTHTNLVSTFPGIVISNGAGPNVILTVQTSTLATAVQGSYATGTPLYVEADTQAIAQVGIVSGMVVTVQGYTNRAASALSSSVWALAQSTTNAAPLNSWITTNAEFESRIDMVETYTSRVVGTESYTARAAIALSSSIWAVAPSTTDYMSRVSQTASNANYEGRIATLEANTNTFSGFGAYTNRAAGALQSSVWVLADSTTNYAPRTSWITTNAAFESRIDVVESFTDRTVAVEGYTNRAASALASSIWALADSTTNYALRVNWIASNVALNARIGLEETNRIALGAIVTNDIVALGAVTTATLSMVTTTNTQAQRVLADFQSGGLLASSNVIAASTNDAMSTNMLVNGDMAQGGNFWTFGGGANSNGGNGGQLIVSAGTSGTAQQSNQFNATAGPWLLSYTNNDPPSTGSIVVSYGGVDHIQAGNLTGYVSWIVGPRNTNGYLITVNSTNGLVSLDNLSLKQIKTGDVTGVYGSFDQLNASNVAVKGNVTAGGTISGTATGYLPLVGGKTMTGSFGMNTNRLTIGSTDSAYLYPTSALGNDAVGVNSLVVDGSIRINDSAAGTLSISLDSGQTGGNTVGLWADDQYLIVGLSTNHRLYLFGDSALVVSNSYIFINTTNGVYSGGVKVIQGDTHYGNGVGLTNITATVTGAVSSLNATGAVSGSIIITGPGVTQTNTTFNFATIQTGQVNSIAVTGAVMGAIQIDAGQNVTLTQTNTTINIAMGSGITQTGQVNSLSRTGAVRGALTIDSGTGITVTQTDIAFNVAASYQPTGAVLSLSNTGAVKGAITFAGNAVTQTNGIFNFLDTSGSAIGVSSNETLANGGVTNIHFQGNALSEVTNSGNEVYVTFTDTSGSSMGISSGTTVLASTTNFVFQGFAAVSNNGSFSYITAPAGGGGSTYTGYQDLVFMAQTGAQVCANGAHSIIQWDHTITNVGLVYNSTTFTFTVTGDGLVEFHGQHQIRNTAVNDERFISAYINSNFFAVIGTDSDAQGGKSAGVQFHFSRFCTNGTRIQVTDYQNEGADRTNDVFSGVNYNNWISFRRTVR